jgi:membrane-associated HD superfamily phosphohydrolase
MKKWILGAAVMTCISLGLSAQHQKKNFRELSALERAEKMSNRMAEELKLTEEQKKQVSKVVLENATRQEELIQKRKEEFEAQKKFRMEQEKKIAAILSEEQKTIWEQRKEAMRTRGKDHSRGDHSQGGRPRFRRGH